MSVLEPDVSANLILTWCGPEKKVDIKDAGSDSSTSHRKMNQELLKRIMGWMLFTDLFYIQIHDRIRQNMEFIDL